MEISTAEAESLLNDPRNLLCKTEYKPLFNGGRSAGAKELSPLMRTLIGVTAHHDTIAATARAFDVSPATVAMAKVGNVGVNHHDPTLLENINKTLGKEEKDIREVALTRMAEMFASSISSESLGTMKPRDAVSAARDLATIVDKMTPKKDSAKTAVFIHFGNEKSEEDYEAVTIHAREVKEVVG